MVAALRSSEGRWAGRAGSIDPQDPAGQAGRERRRVIVRATANGAGPSAGRLRLTPSLQSPAPGAADLRDGLATGNDYVLIEPREGRAMSAAPAVVPPMPSPRRESNNQASRAAERGKGRDRAVPHANGDRPPTLPPSPSRKMEDQVPSSSRSNKSPTGQRPAAGREVEGGDSGSVLKAGRSREAAQGGRPGNSDGLQAGAGSALYATDGGVPMKNTAKWMPDWAEKGSAADLRGGGGVAPMQPMRRRISGRADLEQAGDDAPAPPLSRPIEGQQKTASNVQADTWGGSRRSMGGGGGGSGDFDSDKEGPKSPTSMLQRMARTSSFHDCSVSARGELPPKNGALSARMPVAALADADCSWQSPLRGRFESDGPEDPRSAGRDLEHGPRGQGSTASASAAAAASSHRRPDRGQVSQVVEAGVPAAGREPVMTAAAKMRASAKVSTNDSRQRRQGGESHLFRCRGAKVLRLGAMVGYCVLVRLPVCKACEFILYHIRRAIL